MVPNFRQEIELTEIENDPRYQELCTKHLRAMSLMAAKFASERVQLAIAIKKENVNV